MMRHFFDCVSSDRGGIHHTRGLERSEAVHIQLHCCHFMKIQLQMQMTITVQVRSQMIFLGIGLIPFPKNK